MGLWDLKKPIYGYPVVGTVLIFHLAVAILVIIVIAVSASLLGNTLVTPSAPKGWVDYDAAKGGRDSLTNYMAANGLDVKTMPMNQFSVATANFGGIFTESAGLTNPWIGSVNGEAARLQVEAGARAMVLDIWPDPADRHVPIVAAMEDSTQSIWMNLGLDRGVGRYSNWKHLTRNRLPVGEVLGPALTAAFSGSPGPQNSDPFFLVLNLHGAMTKEYLNHLGNIVHDAIGGNAMGAEWNKCANQKSICTAPVVQFLSKVFVIVIPDIQPGYNSLPNINTYAGFTSVFLNTRLGEVTNAMEQARNTILFEPSGIAIISAPSQANCKEPTGPQQSLAQTGFCIVQPSTGGPYTDNTSLFSNNNYTTCINSGAQFVAVNLFSNDGPLDTFFDPAYFAKYSFRKI